MWLSTHSMNLAFAFLFKIFAVILKALCIHTAANIYHKPIFLPDSCKSVAFSLNYVCMYFFSAVTRLVRVGYVGKPAIDWVDNQVCVTTYSHCMLGLVKPDKEKITWVCWTRSAAQASALVKLCLLASSEVCTTVPGIQELLRTLSSRIVTVCPGTRFCFTVFHFWRCVLGKYCKHNL